MSPEHQRIAIAEAVGWTEIRDPKSFSFVMSPQQWGARGPLGLRPYYNRSHPCLKSEFGGETFEPSAEWWMPILPYPTSREAIHSALKQLGISDRANTGLRVKWINHLRLIVSRDCPTNKQGRAICSDVDLLMADAPELCEATLKAIGKWVES